IDREGTVVSYFHVGLAPHWSREHHMDEMPRSTRFIGHETRTLRGRLTSWYKGYAPVFAADGRFAGGVWIGSSPNGPEKIFGRDMDLLALFPKADTRAGVRMVLLAEYSEGRLLSASADDIPYGMELAASIPGGVVPPEGMWVNDTFGGREYETFYLPTKDRTVLGVSLESLGSAWHFYSYSRYLIFFFVVMLVLGVFYAGVRALKGWAGEFTFRSKLIGAFTLVSIIPVVLLAYYNRQSSQVDAAESTAGYLRRETGLVLDEILEGMGVPVPYELSGYSDDELGDLAAQLNTDFTLYSGQNVQGSSRAELFSAELIDTRISAGAYEALYISDLNFYMEEQHIGTLTYLVGYRPIRSQSGDVIGAVAVPALSRQNQAEVLLAKENVLLYGIYFLVLGISLIVGTVIANQISRPVGRLTAAARRVATGELDVTLETGRGDELGELESAFQAMTSDLKDVQERIVRAERELAWKEMARQVAHEIKNPLTPMRLSLQHLVSAYRKGAEGFGDLLRTVSATVLEQIESLDRIAAEFSTFARFPERRLTVCDLHEVLREAITLHAQGGVRFSEEYTKAPVPVRADGEELRRAFINIIRNSIQATAGRVNISVRTAVREGMVGVVISDDGPGMTPEIRTRLFEPNFSTKTDGMGIGLTIVRKTIIGLGGTVELTSAPGEGTTVSLTFPLAETGGE
ncbi:MAG TPA: ATP-binding protein, partial [Bacteroidota bacterium]|nr:ATP-binding protein [Bacteroidota bacterium]